MLLHRAAELRQRATVQVLASFEEPFYLRQRPPQLLLAHRRGYSLTPPRSPAKNLIGRAGERGGLLLCIPSGAVEGVDECF